MTSRSSSSIPWVISVPASMIPISLTSATTVMMLLWSIVFVITMPTFMATSMWILIITTSSGNVGLSGATFTARSWTTWWWRRISSYSSLRLTTVFAPTLSGVASRRIITTLWTIRRDYSWLTIIVWIWYGILQWSLFLGNKGSSALLWFSSLNICLSPVYSCYQNIFN